MLGDGVCGGLWWSVLCGGGGGLAAPLVDFWWRISSGGGRLWLWLWPSCHLPCWGLGQARTALRDSSISYKLQILSENPATFRKLEMLKFYVARFSKNTKSGFFLSPFSNLSNLARPK